MLSNLPPGVSDYDIEQRFGTDHDEPHFEGNEEVELTLTAQDLDDIEQGLARLINDASDYKPDNKNEYLAKQKTRIMELYKLNEKISNLLWDIDQKWHEDHEGQIL